MTQKLDYFRGSTTGKRNLETVINNVQHHLMQLKLSKLFTGYFNFYNNVIMFSIFVAKRLIKFLNITTIYIIFRTDTFKAVHNALKILD